MTIGLIGKKCGMTRIFSPQGETIPVTVIEALPNRIVQIKNKETDNYCAVQITLGTKKATKVNKSLAGHFVKANVPVGEGLWEFRLLEDEGKDLVVGKEITVELFKVGQMIDVSGISKGKGFAGVIKRHHFSGGPASHGNSLSHRVPGSIGQRQTPGRVFKGKKMAGHLGNVKRSVQNQEIVQVDKERNLVMVKGGVPGAPGGYIVITPAVKIKGDGDGA